MRDCAPTRPFCCLLTLVCFALAHGQAAAAECSEVYPDAQVGPPPEWKFWGDGSACFVRWVPETPDHEDMLLAQCRETAGARFVHFERDSGAGHSICIFKIIDASSPSKASDPGAAEAANPSQALRPTEQQKGNAANPLVEAQILATRWHEDCLKKEEAKDTVSAGMCWKAAAKAMEQFTANRSKFAPRELERKLEQLRSAWLNRAEQLEGRRTASTNDVPAVQPAASLEDRPKPQNSAKLTVVKKRQKKQASRKKLRHKTEVSSKERPPKEVQLQKPKPKKEAALKVFANYTKKEEPRLDRKKPATEEKQKRPPLKCLLFSKLC